MKNKTLTQRVLRHCAGGRHERGSAIILVLVAMVLMAILAGSLLQLARFERIARSESNIEIVIESVIAEILNQATEDLIDANGDFLNSEFTSAAAGDGDEPWDFPWTNPGNFGRLAEFNDGTTVPAIGGSMDDTWLAAHMPDFRGTLPPNSVYSGGPTNTAAGVWRKITSLNRLYLGGNAAGSADLSLNAIPNEFAVTAVTPNSVNSDTNINTTSNLLVDADGDGIGDSRWEWAPLRQVGATQYVMAVRIVDLSARMDMNVATGRFDNITVASASRGDSPVELDGQFFVDNAATAIGGATAASSEQEWRSVLNFRLTSNANPGAATPIGAGAGTLYDNNNANPTAGSRRHLWINGSSRVSNNFNNNGENPAGGFNYEAGTFGTTDAFELLQGNGVNSANTTTVEDLMPNFLRRNAGQEDNFAISGTVNGWNQRGFWELDPRKHVSMFTGASIAASPADINQDRELKLDVNEAVKTPAGRLALRDLIRDFINLNPALLTLYPHLNSAGDLANQLTANIADYIDEDNTVTLVGNKIGFEALPYITEVYTQRPYTVTAVAPAAAGDGSNDVTWSPAPGSSTGYAIEIGNPFGRYDGTTWTGRPVSLENVWLRIANTPPQLLTDLVNVPNDLLQPGEVAIVKLDSTGGNATLDDIAARWATPTGNATIAGTGDATAILADGTRTIALHAEDGENPGTELSAFYSGVRVTAVPNGRDIIENLPTTSTDFSAAVGDTSYVQTNYLGVGQGLRMMVVHPEPQSTNTSGFFESIATLTEPSLNRNDTTGAAEVDTVIPEFTSETKTGATTALGGLDGQQIVWPDSPRERMHWIGDILQIPATRD